MIILRQKEYSTKLGRNLARFNRFVLRRPKIKAYRKAIKTDNSIKNAINSAKDKLNEAALNPGNVLNKDIIGPSIETPVTATALKAVPLPGTSALIKKVNKPEKYLLKKLKIADKLENISHKYTDSKVAKNIEKTINGTVDVLKNTALFN